MIIKGTKSPLYDNWFKSSINGRYNGAYYYAREIEDIILPNIEAEVYIITAGGTLYKPYQIPEFSVIVCHDNQNPMKSYRNFLNKKILWICSKQSTFQKIKSKGEKAAYIPLSIDTKYVKQFKTRKTKDTAYVGNQWNFKKPYLQSLPAYIDQLSNKPRETLLAEMAKYKNVIAEGRCLMEAQVLGCKAEIPDYGNPKIGAIFREPVDSRDVIDNWRDVLQSHANMHPRRFLTVSKRFKDMKAGIVRPPLQVFSVGLERAEELLNNPLKLVQECR